MTISARPGPDALMDEQFLKRAARGLTGRAEPAGHGHCTWRRRWKTDAACLTSGSEPAAPLGRATDRDSGRRPIEDSWQAATTLSNRNSGGCGTSCAISAEKRLHDPVHENDNSDHQ